MRVEHIPLRRKVEVVFPKKLLTVLPGKVALFTTTQYLHLLEGMKEQLEKAGKVVLLYKPRHTSKEGQVLGCSIQEWPDAEAFLYVGEGEFHPRALLFKNPQPVFRYDPLQKKYQVFSKDDVSKIMKQHRGAMLKFMHAKVVGVLVSTKSGQKDNKAFSLLVERYPEKEFVPILYNTLDWGSLEDFPFVEVWVNTGCPRIGLDDYNKVKKPILNAEHVLDNHHF